MARQNIITYDSTEVQGEGSWIKVRLLKHGQAKQLTRAFGGVAGKGPDEIAPEQYDELQKTNEELVSSAVFDWNWTDDDGQPLPLPKDDPAVIDELTELEHQFIGNALRGVGERKKS